MTAIELIELLKQLPPDRRVMISDPNEEDSEGNGVFRMIEGVESMELPEFPGEDPGDGADIMWTSVIYSKPIK